jgi:oxygen-independent coproporphyrinogen-3 oxidase
LPTETEILTLQDHKNELILTSLRTKWGCDVSIFQNSPTHMKELENLEKNGFLYIENNLACLTKKGKLVADAVTERLLFE